MASLLDVPTFHWADYLLFVASVIVCLFIGVFFAILDKKNKRQTSSEFSMAGRNMQFIPVGFSIMLSVLNAVAILGTPGEIMLNGTMFSLGLIGWVLAAIFGPLLFVPVFHGLKLTTVYLYLELRFNRIVRVIGVLVFLVMMITFMTIVLYAPALAFSTVTGLSLWGTTIGIGVVCATYTTLGGMRAVIWTDTFQFSVIVIGLIVLLIKGSIDVGGMEKVMNISREGGRLQFDVFSVDPRVRHTVWNQVIGTCFLITSMIGSNQLFIQRYIAVKKLWHAQLSVVIAIFGALIIFILLILLGLVMYAYYGCNPVTQGIKPAQLVPLFMMHVLGNIHGLPGLLTASVFAAALSTVSSVIHALACVCMQDIVQPLYLYRNKKELAEKYVSILVRALAFFFGLLTVTMSYVAQFLGPLLIQLSYSIFGTMGGPTFGLFILAIFFPMANSWGAAIGTITSFVVAIWLNVGSILNVDPPVPLPLRTEDCPSVNMTETMMNMTEPSLTASAPTPALHEFYKISYMWYTLFSTIVVLVVGLLVSAITGFNKNTDKRLVFSYRNCCRFSADTSVKDFQVVADSDMKEDKALCDTRVSEEDGDFYKKPGYNWTHL